MENLPNNKEIVRPKGAHEDDFNDLSDAAIVELYSNSKLLKNDTDIKNVEAEFERRNMEGTLDMDFELEDDYDTQMFMNEMLSHGYSIDEEGEIHYPTPEYKAWINSDRSEPAPRGIIRETIKERIADQELKDADALYDSFDRANNKKIGKSAMAQSNAEIIKLARKQQEKLQDIQLFERRKAIEHINNNGVIGGVNGIQAKANMENIRVDDAKHEKTARPVVERVEKLANYYKENIEKVAYDSTAVGVTKAIEKGNFHETPEEYVKNGFWVEESDRIHNRLDPENTHSKDALEAELLFQTEKRPSIIKECSDSLSSRLMKEAQKDGSEFAIYTGAYVNDYTDKVIFSIPPENGAEARKFMEHAGVNFAPAASSDKEFRMKVHGFANIIDAVDNYPTVKEEGFKSLDWYFDNFEFGSDMPKFLDEIGQYYDEEEDEGFAKTLKEYLAHRKETEEYDKAVERKIKRRPRMKSFKKITGNIEADYEEFCREEDELDKVYHAFNEKSKTGPWGKSQSDSNFEQFKWDQGDGYVRRRKNYLSAKEKYNRAKESYEDILTIDPSADFYRVVFETPEDGIITRYCGIRFGINDYNVAILAPIQRLSNDAAFVVVGKPGIENPDDWILPFQEDPQENVTANKLTVRSREDVKAFNHIESKKGMNDALDAIWMRITKHILKTTAV